MADGTQVGSIYYDLDLDDSKFKGKVQNASQEVKGLTSVFEKAEKGSWIFAGALLGVATAAGGVIAKSALTAARTETLGVAMEAVAKATGTSTKVLAEQEAVMKKQGITTQEARNNLILFMQSQLDVAQASKVARVAQDLAVIGNMNSSEASAILTQAIANQNILMLRQFGIVTTSTQIFDKYAATLHKSGDELTDVEKKQAFVNEILEQGKKVAGTYEAAMTSVGKKLTSLPRYFQEAENAIGTVFLPAFGLLVDALTNFLKQVNVENVQKFMKLFVDNLPIIAGAIIGGLLPALRALGISLWKNVITPLMVLAPWIIAGAAIGVGIKLLIDYFGGWEVVTKKLETALSNLGTYIQGKLTPFVDYFSTKIDRVRQILANFGISGEFGTIINLFQNLGDKVDFVQTKLERIGQYVQIFKDKLAGFGEGQTASWIDALEGVLTRIHPLIQAVKDSLQPLMDQLALTGAIIQTQLVPAWNALMETLQPLIDAISPQLKAFIKDVLMGIVVALVLIITTVLAVFTGFVTAVANALPYITQALEGFIQFIRGFVQFLTGLLNGDIGLMLEGFKQMFVGAAELVMNTLTAIEKFVSGFVKGVINFFMNLYNALVGKSIIPDLINGIVSWFEKMPGMIASAIGNLYEIITSPFKRAFDQVKQWASDALNAVKNALDFTQRHSPSVIDIVKNGVGLVNQELANIGTLTMPTMSDVLLDKMGSSNTSNQTINVSVGQVSGMQDVQMLTREIGFKIGTTPQ